MSNDFIQNAVNNLYRDNEVAALKAELANLKAKADQSEAENARLKAQIDAKMEVGVPYADYERLFAENARLKSECQARQAENSVLAVECDSLKAEVERLEKDVWRMKVFKGIDEDTKATLKNALNTVPEWAKVLETEAENARLKAEVERLTKAALQVHQELDEFGQVSAKSVHELREAAKGGQP